jgi:hypothetical protein
MNRIISIIFFLVFSSTNFFAQENLKISYSGYFQDHLETYPKLQFEIINLTNDTLYFSNDNLKFEVIKNSEIVVEEKPHFGNGLPFLRPKFEKCPEIQIQKQNLSKTFAKKLISKNNISNVEIENLLQAIELACIVLYPKEIVYVEKVFFNKNFDRNYEVKIKNYDRKIFTIYRTDSDKLIKIKI